MGPSEQLPGPEQAVPLGQAPPAQTLFALHVELVGAFPASAINRVMATAVIFMKTARELAVMSPITRIHASGTDSAGVEVLPHELPEAAAARADYLKEALGISGREFEVLELVRAGFTNKEIAEQLFLSPYTVKSYLTKISNKLGVGGTRQRMANKLTVAERLWEMNNFSP